MWERRLPEPRLTSWWTPADGVEPLPVLAEMRRVLSAHYGESFDSIGFNCYRDGNDSVAWHGDRHRHTIDDPVVAIVSVGAARPFRLRPAWRQVERRRGRSISAAATCSSWAAPVSTTGSTACPRWPTPNRAISITYRHGAR